MLKFKFSTPNCPKPQLTEAPVQAVSLKLPESFALPEVRMVVQRPFTKHRVMDILRVQLIEFSKATFHFEARGRECLEGFL